MVANKICENCRIFHHCDIPYYKTVPPCAQKQQQLLDEITIIANEIETNYNNAAQNHPMRIANALRKCAERFK
jgi:hypothetical protein